MDNEIIIGIITGLGIWLILNRKIFLTNQEKLKSDVNTEKYKNITFVEGFFRDVISISNSELQVAITNSEHSLLNYVQGFNMEDLTLIAKAQELHKIGNVKDANQLLAKNFYPYFQRKDFSDNDIDYLTLNELLLLVKLVFKSTPSTIIKRYSNTDTTGTIFIEKERYDCLVLQSKGKGISVFKDGMPNLYLVRDQSSDIELKYFLKKEFEIRKMATHFTIKTGINCRVSSTDIDNMLRIRSLLLSKENISRAISLAK